MLDFIIQGTHSPFFVAREKGYYKAEGLNVAIDAGKGGTNTAVSVASNVYQFGYVDLVTMVNFNVQNPANPLLAVYMAFDETPLAVMTLKSKGIKTPRDLHGRKIAGGPGTAVHDTMSILLKAAKAEDVKIDWVSVSIQLWAAMLAKGEVDGIGGFTNSQIPAAMAVGFKREDIYARQVLRLRHRPLRPSPGHDQEVRRRKPGDRQGHGARAQPRHGRHDPRSGGGTCHHEGRRSDDAERSRDRSGWRWRSATPTPSIPKRTA